ncbi:MAG: Hsp20/alpha crystallin family protein [Candidatus Bathyarchaeia archaeon]
MAKKKEAASKGSSKKEVPVEKKEKAIAPRKKESPFAPSASDPWRAFDQLFESFRNDFEDLLFPSAWTRAYPIMAETRVPLVDLEDRDKDYMLKAEMPGFKKEDIEIEVQEDSVEITGNVGWKYDKKAKDYICKERACESFYRSVQLPEEIKTDEVKANLTDGVLEVVLPKKAPKKARKIPIK